MIDYTVATVLLAAVLSYIAYKVFKSGLLGNAEVLTTEKPKFIGQSLVVYYKHHVGHYKGCITLMHEARDLLPKGATTFGVYYDDPNEVPEHLLQSAAGVVFAEDGNNLYQDNYSEQLTRAMTMIPCILGTGTGNSLNSLVISWGYEKMVLPAVSRAVQATQPFTGWLSLLALVQKTYAAIMAYVKEHRLETSVVLEFYSGETVSVLLPLDHQNEFFVPEHMTQEELESKLARKKFDSDEEDSESEPEHEGSDEENADEAPETSGKAETEEEIKVE